MPDFEKLTPELSRLFLRIDAAGPTDPLLRAAATSWQERRHSAPQQPEQLMAELPASVRPHAFLAQLTVDGGKRWAFSGAGGSAGVSLGLDTGLLSEIPDQALAERLAALLDLVEAKDEPQAVMFELKTDQGLRFCEAYAAPLGEPEPRRRFVLVALTSRLEPTR